MKRILIMMTITAVLLVGLGPLAIAGDGPKGAGAETGEHTGPAPNSGDGVSDGSGLDTGHHGGEKGAPNSGDGTPDGSGK